MAIFVCWESGAICASANVTVASSNAVRVAAAATDVILALSFVLPAIPSAADSWSTIRNASATSYQPRRVLPST